jgi:predicted metal-binding protein
LICASIALGTNVMPSTGSILSICFVCSTCVTVLSDHRDVLPPVLTAALLSTLQSQAINTKEHQLVNATGRTHAHHQVR